MRIVHKSHDLVTELCRAWSGKEEAKIQAGIIVRELCRAGMLVGAKMQGMSVVDVREQPGRWWLDPDRDPLDAIGGYRPTVGCGPSTPPASVPNQHSSVQPPVNSCCPMHDAAWLARNIGGLIPRTDGFDRDQTGIDIAAALLLYDQHAHGAAGERQNGNEIGTHCHDATAPDTQNPVT